MAKPKPTTISRHQRITQRSMPEYKQAVSEQKKEIERFRKEHTELEEFEKSQQDLNASIKSAEKDVSKKIKEIQSLQRLYQTNPSNSLRQQISY